MKKAIKGSTKGLGKQLKGAAKKAAKKALKAGAKQLVKSVKEIVNKKHEDESEPYTVNDEVKPLSQIYSDFGNELCKLGRALEKEGEKISVGQKVIA